MARRSTTQVLEAKLAKLEDDRNALMRKLQESRKADEARVRAEAKRRQASGGRRIEEYVGRPLTEDEYMRLARIAYVMTVCEGPRGGDTYASLLQEIESHGMSKTESA